MKALMIEEKTEESTPLDVTDFARFLVARKEAYLLPTLGKILDAAGLQWVCTGESGN